MKNQKPVPDPSGPFSKSPDWFDEVYNRTVREKYEWIKEVGRGNDADAKEEKEAR